MNISDEAFEAAKLAYRETLTDLRLTEGGGFKVASQVDRSIRAALEAAAPILLSHERQLTADAHRDAIVNRDTVDRLEQELQQAKAAAWDEGYGAMVLDAFRDQELVKRGSRLDSNKATRNPYRSAGAGE